MIGRVGRGILDFIVGDDWRVALWVALSLAATALLVAAGLPGWWFIPIATVAILRASVRRASRGQVGSGVWSGRARWR
ncbi:MAG TPA: hypothetical protein VFX45_02175 [Solirubrobacterales bacterium]|nr:hypothetical protein [Solirubrobacterales bacterium]